MRGGGEWTILGKKFNDEHHFSIEYKFNNYNYSIKDNKLYHYVLNWIDAEDGDEREPKMVGELKGDNILEIGDPQQGHHHTLQLEKDTYIITKVKVSTTKYQDSELTIKSQESSQVDKEFILYNTKNRIINYIKDIEDETQPKFINNVGIDKLNILKQLKEDYKSITGNISQGSGEIDAMLDTFVTLLKSITK